MKKLLLMASAAMIFLAACNTKKTEDLNSEKRIVFSDTSLTIGNASTDVAPAGNTTPAVVPTPAPKPEVRTITKYVTVREKAPKAQPRPNNPPVNQPTEEPIAQAPLPGTTASTGTGTDNTTTTPAPVKKKEGWSDAAKGATIGGVGGAVAGAVIGKGTKGAVIGGVLGAAGGYILGRRKDKQSGRVELTPQAKIDSANRNRPQ